MFWFHTHVPQILEDFDHAGFKPFSLNTTAGSCFFFFKEKFIFIHSLVVSSGSLNENIKQCQTLNKALGASKAASVVVQVLHITPRTAHDAEGVVLTPTAEKPQPAPPATQQM